MKRISLFATLAFAFGWSQSGSAQCNGRYQTDVFTNVDVTSNIQYGSNVDLNSNTVNLMLDFYEPQGDTASQRPLVIFAHGGSFIGGTKTDPELVYFATELAKKGYACASITYRLAGSAFDLLAEETTVKVVFNAIQDGKAAIRFFRQDAATTNNYKIDTNQIFIGGTSAGAILGINLTYVDNITDLPAQWQTWANEVGGIEGNSGNPGYCSRSNGTFGFAGAIADTNWIDADDAPWYGSHAQNDQTVKYGYGKPLNGTNPVNLYGSSLMALRLNNQGIYYQFDSYTGGDHPPFANSTSIRQDNKDSLAMFLYNILDCNPSNLKKPSQKTCATNPTGIAQLQKANVSAIYPNPVSSLLTIEVDDVENSYISIFNVTGQLMIKERLNNYIHKMDLSDLNSGVYILKIDSKDNTTTQSIVKQ